MLFKRYGRGVLTPRSTVLRRQVLVATWLSYFGFYFCRKAWGVVKADIQKDLGFSTAEIANIGTILLVTYMLGMFVSAGVGRRFGAKALLLFGMIGSVAINVSFGLGTTYAAFATFMAANGFAQSAGWPGNIGMLSHWYRRDERGTVMGAWSTCYSVGAGAAKGFAGSMVALAIAKNLPGYHWSWAFWGAAVVLFFIVVFFYVFAKNKPEDADEPEIVADEPSADAPKSSWQAYLRVLTNRTVLIVGATYFCFKFLRYAIDSWAPYIFRNMGMTTQEAAWASTGFDWAGMFGMIATGWISDRYFGGRRAAACLWSTVLLVFALAFGYFSASAAAMIVAFSLTGLFMYGPDSLLSGAGAADVADDKESAVAAAGIINGLGSIGPIVQEQVVARLVDPKKGAMNLDAMNLMFLALGLVAAAALAWLYRRGQKHPQHAF